MGTVSALAQAAAVRSGEVTAVELVEAALAELERRAELNAFVTLRRDRAVAEDLLKYPPSRVPPPVDPVLAKRQRRGKRPA